MIRLVYMATLLLLWGCAANPARQTVAAQPIATSQPAEAAVDVQQISGQIAAGVQAELKDLIHAEVEAKVEAQVDLQLKATGIGGNATGYMSEFGVGAVAVVCLALLLTLVQSVLLFLALRLIAKERLQSHERAVARIQNGVA